MKCDVFCVMCDVQCGSQVIVQHHCQLCHLLLLEYNVSIVLTRPSVWYCCYCWSLYWVLRTADIDITELTGLLRSQVLATAVSSCLLPPDLSLQHFPVNKGNTSHTAQSNAIHITTKNLMNCINCIMLCKNIFVNSHPSVWHSQTHTPLLSW